MNEKCETQPKRKTYKIVQPLKTEQTLFEKTGIVTKQVKKTRIKKVIIKTPQDKIKAKYYSLLKRAQEKQVPATITLDVFQSMLTASQECPICHVPYASDNPASVDRLIPQLGYVPENVAIICYHCNTVKNNATLAQLEAIVSWLHKVLSL